MEKLLDRVESPADLKALSVPQLEVLAGEIRQFLIDGVSRTGGHLASSLGVVELTLALHYVFDFQRDKLLWDVGHQCYVHKIVTGRKQAFSNLRRSEGVSGFPDPAESPYDHFAVGHAGTAVATAIGMALGQAMNKASDKIVALVGDASIVNGTSFEALNNLGLIKRQMLIVLNDNSMAIDTTQGAVAKYFSRVRLSHTYEDIRRSTAMILEHVPVIGRPVEEVLAKIKKSIRMVLPASHLFESLHIPYFGPVDGHDTASLVRLFKALSHLGSPAILHVYTKKGKGFTPAEEDKPRFHSTGPFTVNGRAVEAEPGPEQPSFTDVFGRHLVSIAQRDHRVVAITSAMCGGTGLAEFRRRFSDRFYDVGIAESAAVDIAAGMAREGLRPVVCIYSTFLQRSFDQIFQEVALQNLPVVFCIDRAGLVGADGPTHHGLMDTGFLRMMPGLTVVAPACATEMEMALDFAFQSPGAVCIRYPKDAVPVSCPPACGQRFAAGKAVLMRNCANPSVVIASYGSVMGEAVAAAEMLEYEGVDVELINARFAAPVDQRIVETAEGRVLVTVEDHQIACGFGSAVLELAAARGLMPSAVRLLGVPNKFVKHDSRSRQIMRVGINADKIAQVARRLLCRSIGHCSG